MKQFTLLILLVLMACNDKETRLKALQDIDRLQQNIEAYGLEISHLQQELIYNKAEWEVANDKISQAKNFQLFRTAEGRSNDIRNAVAYKIEIEKNIQMIEARLQVYSDSIGIVEREINQLKTFLSE